MERLVTNLHERWLRERKAAYHMAAGKVLMDHGILGVFVLIYAPKETRYAAAPAPRLSMYTNFTEASRVIGILFSDPKLEFVYILKGGNEYFLPLFRTEYETAVLREDWIREDYGND
jgi:hypothetical protein